MPKKSPDADGVALNLPKSDPRPDGVAVAVPFATTCVSFSSVATW